MTKHAVSKPLTPSSDDPGPVPPAERDEDLTRVSVDIDEWRPNRGHGYGPSWRPRVHARGPVMAPAKRKQFILELTAVLKRWAFDVDQK